MMRFAEPTHLLDRQVIVRYLALLLAVAAVSCDVLGPDESAVRIDVDEAAITLDPSTERATVPFTVMNSSGAAAFVAACGDRVMSSIERFENGSWIVKQSSLCLTVYSMTPLRLDRGERAAGHAGVSEPGLYRIRVSVASDADGSGERTETSGTFLVEF